MSQNIRLTRGKLSAGTLTYRYSENNQIEFLLVYREMYNDWSLPKGGVEYKEMLQLTAERETLEETGVAIQIEEYIGLIELKFSKPDQYDFDFWNLIYFYLAKPVIKDPTIKALDPDENVTDIQWLSPDEAKNKVTKKAYAQIIDKGLEIISSR